MSLSIPNNPPTVNEAVAKPVSTAKVFGVDENQTKINQLHGITSNNAQGAGIPKQVSNAQVSIANASTGSTCTVSVLFKADPTDSSLSGVNVWVRGYQGNNNPVLVGSGTASPTKIVLNNTGETVTFTIQAFGNGGNAPFGQAPTCSGTLPKSTGGGFGSSAVVAPPAVSGSASPGQLAKFATPATTLTGADLTGDVVTSGSVATTVQKIQSFPVSANTPLEEDVFIYKSGIWTPLAPPFAVRGLKVQIQSTAYNAQGIFGMAAGNIATGGSATSTFITPTASQAALIKTATAITASTLTVGWYELNVRSTLGIMKRWHIKLRADQTTNCRIWMALYDGTLGAGVGNAFFATDTPNTSYVGFRYSSGTDTNWKAICATSNVNQTVVDTGVAPDTSNPQTFDVIWDGTNVNFYINRARVAQISTNVPDPSLKLQGTFAVDNKNTANVASYSFGNHFYWEEL